MDEQTAKEKGRALSEKLLAEIRRLTAGRKKPMRLMEVCGTHTVSIFRTGLRQLLPAEVELVSGPGCPVCVTPDGYMNAAIAYAGMEDVIVATFGDMLKVPGSSSSLAEAMARGGDVRIVYSPLDAITIAKENWVRDHRADGRCRRIDGGAGKCRQFLFAPRAETGAARNPGAARRRGRADRRFPFAGACGRRHGQRKFFFSCGGIPFAWRGGGFFTDRALARDLSPCAAGDGRRGSDRERIQERCARRGKSGGAKDDASGV